MSRQDHIENLSNRRGFLAHDLFSLDYLARVFRKDVTGGARDTARRVRDDLQETRHTLTEDSARVARTAMQDTRSTARMKSREAANNVAEALDPRPYVRQYPYASVALASGVGLGGAWLLLRARDRRLRQQRSYQQRYQQVV